MVDRNIPKLPTSQREAVAVQGNEIIDALRALGLIQHIGLTDLVTTADATDLPTGQTLGNALKAAYNTHIASTDAHDAADATNGVSSANATDQSSLNTLLNEMKTDFNAHLILSAAHGARVAGDGRVTVATVATANASDLSTSIALVNALKRAINVHFASGARRVTYFGP
jgi:hypothetical protein